MEFWNLYRVVKSRIWMILGLMLVTLLVIFIAKKAADEQIQYSAASVVLPDLTAMSGSGVIQGDKSVLGPTYDRFSRMAQFTTAIREELPDVLKLAAQPSSVQKEFLAEAIAPDFAPAAGDALRKIAKASLPGSKLTSDEKSKLLAGAETKSLLQDLQQQDVVTPQDAASLSSPQAGGVDSAMSQIVDAALQAHQLPTDPTVFSSRIISDQTAGALQSSLVAAPIVNDNINTTPGGTTPTPVITDYLQIQTSAPDATTAEQVANLLAAYFIDGYQQQGDLEFNNTYSKAIADENEAQAQFKQAQTQLVSFESANPYVDVPTSVTNGVGNLVSLQRSLEQSQSDLLVYQQQATTLDQLANKVTTSFNATLDPRARPEYKQLQAQVLQDQEQLQVLSTVDTPQNPQYQKAKARVQAEKQELNILGSEPYEASSPNAEFTALQSQANQARASAAAAQARINYLNQQISQQEAKNKQLPNQEATLVAYQEDLAADKQALDQAKANVNTLKNDKQQFNQGMIQLTSGATDAAPNTNGPSLIALLLYGAILSLILGVGVAIGLEYLDTSVQTIPDAEKLLEMPISAVIPAMPAGDPRRMTRLILTDPLSPISESYRILRTDLLFTAEDKPFQSLMAATAKPGQGATTTICNLAVALAAVGKRVILIDADLRRPKLHDFFGVSNDTGLTSLLREECELEEALKVTDIDNLLILPSGPLPLNPAELLASQKMRALHERLKPHTDFVLVNTPSAIAFSDASILASYLDAVMIVVRAQETPRGSEIQLKNLLNKARANVVGVVLNGVKPQLVDSYFYHAAYYPQVSPGHALNGNGAILPPPTSNGNGSHTRTLEGETVAQAVASRPDEENSDVETTAIMEDDIVTVTPPAPRSRMSLRKIFGAKDPEA